MGDSIGEAGGTKALRGHRAGGGLVFAGTIGNMLSVTPGIISTFGLFLVPVATEFGWPRSVVSGALAIVLFGNAIGSAPAGRLADRFGSRRVILFGNILLAASIAMLALAPASPLLFYLQFAVVGVIGALASNMVIAKLLADSFDDRRGLFIGIAGGIGNGLGSAILPAFAAILIALHGWREAYLGLALAIFVIGFPVLYAFIKTPRVEMAEQQGIEAEGPGLGEALRSPVFWLLATSVPLGGGCLQALFATIEPFLADRGMSIGEGTSVLALFALTCAIWEPTVGLLLDRTQTPRLLAPCYATGLAGLLLLLFAKALPLVMLSGVLLGIALGAEFSAVAFLLSRYFGRHALGAISGVIFGLALLVSAVAAVALNVCFDVTGSYFAGLLVIVPLLAWNSLAMIFLPAYFFMSHSD
ncbi:MFS transporter [Novosphingobium album (ex Hu et al. 2023)]|uniref:MFS transporter n=1 Tax=Novosphingobium album (ex Hu et al. 2023) TaxID=2930093 RepID=A0ABT0B525_9SPHN|nr:MFS transporter [Novosphingobium album (ex Hu et al. 2023)]MCJ2179985.1 MFS transporter [Novosphingobium album (ex Hu et al. 2023)]